MQKKLSEQVVLKKLGIENFRHLTKDKVITMTSMLDSMDPEVAKKALELFPDFSNTMITLFNEQKASLDKALEFNQKGVESYYKNCDEIIIECKNLLQKEPLTFEERKYILDKMTLILILQGEKDTENKKFLFALSALGTLGLVYIATVLASTLGGKTKINLEQNS